jgi:hypothetical protein
MVKWCALFVIEMLPRLEIQSISDNRKEVLPDLTVSVRLNPDFHTFFIPCSDRASGMMIYLFLFPKAAANGLFVKELFCF